MDVNRAIRHVCKVAMFVVLVVGLVSCERERNRMRSEMRQVCMEKGFAGVRTTLAETVCVKDTGQ